MAAAGGSYKQRLNVVMFPLFAFGHITPFLHLSNRLAARGHRVGFLLPGGALDKVAHLNEYPALITFHPIVVPHVEGLPRGAETTADVPAHLVGHIFAALDATEDQFRSIVRHVRPDFVLYDAAPWVPRVGRELGFKSVSYGIVSAAASALRLVPSMRIVEGMTDDELARTPLGYPSSTVVPRPDEIAMARVYARKFGSVSLYERIVSVMSGSDDVMAMRTCRELEGQFCDYMEGQYGKRVLFTGPVMPNVNGPGLDEKWAAWLGKYPPGSVVYCAFGSEVVLQVGQFQEILRGFELSGRPFLAALRPPKNCRTVEEAFPERFKERVIDGEQGRGMVCGGWVPQPQILDHPSVGCFVSHCGFGSMWEALLSDCQILLIPNINEQIVSTMFMTKELKVAVEVEKDEKGWISKEKLCLAVESVMGGESEVGKEVRENHLKLRKVLGDKNLQDKYVDEFVGELYGILKES